MLKAFTYNVGDENKKYKVVPIRPKIQYLISVDGVRMQCEDTDVCLDLKGMCRAAMGRLRRESELISVPPIFIKNCLTSIIYYICFVKVTYAIASDIAVNITVV